MLSLTFCSQVIKRVGEEEGVNSETRVVIGGSAVCCMLLLGSAQQVKQQQWVNGTSQPWWPLVAGQVVCHQRPRPVKVCFLQPSAEGNANSFSVRLGKHWPFSPLTRHTLHVGYVTTYLRELCNWRWPIPVSMLRVLNCCQLGNVAFVFRISGKLFLRWVIKQTALELHASARIVM